MASSDKGGSRKVTLRNRARYHFDNLLSRGTGAGLVFLAAVTLAAVLVAAALLAISSATFDGSTDASWVEDSWQSLLRMLDPGTLSDDVGWGERLLALLVTVFGILVAGTLIGLVATGIEQRVTELRRGRSTVVESGHMVILGASARLPVVVEQLALANRRRRRNAIVVLANREPDELWDDVRGYADDLYSTRLIFRWGDPTRTSDLAITRIQDARGVIVLADHETVGDAGAVKSVLAAGAALGGFDRMPIIVDVEHPETADGLSRACRGSVYPLVAMQSVARIMAFALSEPGLSQVVTELLDFRGCDVHLHEAGELTGQPFGESVSRFADARPIGIMRPDGSVELNPEPEVRFEVGDRLILIAEDDQAPEVATGTPTDTERRSARRPAGLQVGRDEEHVLVIGWNAMGSQLLSTLEQRAAPGSSVEIVYSARLFESDELPDADTTIVELVLTPRSDVTWKQGQLNITAKTTSIVFLGYRRGMGTEEADSSTLLNLMMVRRELRDRSEISPRIVVELLNADNVELARVTGADDYVISDAVISRLMAQLVEQPERRPVLQSLYTAGGPSLHLVEAEDIGLSGDVRFDQIVSVAYAAGLLALGWRHADERGGEVAFNPRSSEHVRLAAGDQIVVIG
jgi:Trk K+ transport system NAD-binding subunit